MAIPLPDSVPDLRLTAASAPTAASVGHAIDITWTVANSSNEPAFGSWQDAIYLSQDSSYDAGDLLLSSSSGPAVVNGGESYASHLSLQVPNVEREGIYQLLFVSDAQATLAEADEDNNSLAIPISLDLKGPDLTILSVDAPAETAIGSSITIHWLVQNRGDTATTTAWEDSVYLSSDPVLDPEDSLLTSFSGLSAAPLASGADYAASRSITLPTESQGGEQYLIVRTDEYDSQGEASETNNELMAPLLINRTGPDLKITSAFAVDAASVGTPILLSWTVTNQGESIADRIWDDGIYLSIDNQYDYSDTWLSTIDAGDRSPLSPGSSYTNSTVLSAPSVGSAGQYHLLFITNPYQDQWETNYDNNTVAIPISINLNGPDLQLFSVTAPARAKMGETITFSWTVRNSGSLDTDTDWYDDVFLSRDPQFDNDDVFLDLTWIANSTPLTPGASYSRSLNLTIPNDLLWDGNYFLIVRTDPAQYQGEASESNNSLIVPIEIVDPLLVLPAVTLTDAVLSCDEDVRINQGWQIIAPALTHIFSRTGPTDNPLEVPFHIGGTATEGVDYNGISLDPNQPSTGVLRFEAGSSTARLVIMPVGDALPEADETITLTLQGGSDYELVGTTSVTSTIVDDDTSIESLGNAFLLRDGNGKAHVQQGSRLYAVSAPWGADVGEASSTWKMLGAETVDGVNMIVLRYKPTQQLHTWTMDASWNWQSSSGLINRRTPEGWALETGFQMDLNRDSIIGAPFTTIESQGNTSLLRRQDGQAFVRQGANTFAVYSPWGASPIEVNSDWHMIGAESIGGYNTILWGIRSTNQLHIWNLGPSWSWQGSSGMIDRTSQEALALETGFRLDLNGDSIIGPPNPLPGLPF